MKKNKKILIVEDEPSLRKLLMDIFVKEGFEVSEAADGSVGLEVALKEKPDLILLDIIMPRMDGITMCERLREDEWGKEVPIILLTNLAEEEKIAEAHRQGVYDYLVKSDWKLTDVVEKVKDRLKI